jgi:hypothetical protein
MKSHEPTGSPLKRLARPEMVKRIFASSGVVPNGGNAMGTQSRGIAQVIRIPNAQSEAPAPLCTDEPAGVDEWLSSHREETVRQLATWQAPALPNEVVEALATIFLMQPGHKLIPFFVWLEDRLRR